MNLLYIISFFVEMFFHFVITFWILLIENLLLFITKSKVSFEKVEVVKDYLNFVNKRKDWYVKRLLK